MKSVFIVAALAVFAGVVAGAVVELDESNFDTVVDGSKAVFVEFFAPWCGHCKRLAPEYKIAGDAFERSTAAVIASVDCDSHKTVCSRFGVSGYPTLKFFPKGATEPEAYSGGRTAADIVDFVNKKAGTRARIKKDPEAVVELTPDNFDEIVMNEDDFVLVEFFAPWCGHCKTAAPHYEATAKGFKNVPNCVVAKVDSDKHKELAARFGVSGYPTFKAFSKTDKSGDNKYSGGRTEEDFVKYLNEQCGAQRAVGGGLLPTAGRIGDLDELALTYIGADEATRTSTLASAEEIVSGLSGEDVRAGKFYLAVMKKIASKGAEFVDTEPERMERMIASGAVAENKLDEFAVRQNILRVFKEGSAASDGE